MRLEPVIRRRLRMHLPPSQVKKVADSQGDPKKIIREDLRTYENGTIEVDMVYGDGTVEVAQIYVNGTLVVDNAPALLQDLE